MALVFAELASHFPVAGSIYQWSKRLSHRTLGWFTGWFYFWAQVLTVTAVAVIVALRRRRSIGRGQEFLDCAVADPGAQHVHVHRDHDPRRRRRSSTPSACGCCRSSTTSAWRPRSWACSCSRWSCCSSPTTSRRTSCSRRSRPEDAQEREPAGHVRARHVHVDLHRLRLRHGRDASARRRSTPAARRRAASCPRSGCPASSASIFLLAVILAHPGHPGGDGRRPAGGFPIATTIIRTSTAELSPGSPFGEIYLVVILVSVFVCTLAIQGAATRMMFSMGRDRHLPLGSGWGHVNPTFRTPANAADRGRRPRGPPDPA